MTPSTIPASVWATAFVALAGCSAGGPPAARTPPTTATAGDDVVAERAKLSPEDRAAVAAQEWCAVNADERLGSMGPPVKVMVKDQPVYLCCGGCKKEALAEPDKTLATVAAHKAKAKP